MKIMTTQSFPPPPPPNTSTILYTSGTAAVVGGPQMYDYSNEKALLNGKPPATKPPPPHSIQLKDTNATRKGCGGGGSGSLDHLTATSAADEKGSSCGTKRRGCCRCMGPKSTAFWIGLLTNLGICTLLLAYTLLGSFMFMAIEGGTPLQQQILASTTKRNNNNNHVVPNSADRPPSHSSGFESVVEYRDRHSHHHQPSAPTNITFSPAAIRDTIEARHKTVENIWDITVSLNILYRENWTRLAALEIARFQDQVIKRLRDDMALQLEGTAPVTNAVILHTLDGPGRDIEWTFPKAFLYSLTVLTTIGYGCMAPRTTLGRMMTLVYAILGIPLTLIYLSSTGGVLAKVARGVFSRALCCCLCSNCGYCCYDEKRMAEKERRMKKKRQLEERRAQQQLLQEPYYVSGGGGLGNGGGGGGGGLAADNNPLHSPEEKATTAAAAHFQADIDSLSTTCTESKTSMHGLSLLAPILLCLAMIALYIAMGALVLFHLENFAILDGVYFCFMSLSTIGFGDLVPGLRRDSTDTTTWFCSVYIMSGMALTAMCFNVLHEEIVHRIRHVVVEIKKSSLTGDGASAAGQGAAAASGAIGKESRADYPHS